MRFRYALLPVSLVLLAACSDTLADIQIDTEDALRAASGSTADWQKTLSDTVELGRLEAEKLKKGIEEAAKTAEQVQEGIGQVQEGIKAVEDVKAKINF